LVFYQVLNNHLHFAQGLHQAMTFPAVNGDRDQRRLVHTEGAVQNLSKLFSAGYGEARDVEQLYTDKWNKDTKSPYTWL